MKNLFAWIRLGYRAAEQERRDRQERQARIRQRGVVLACIAQKVDRSVPYDLPEPSKDLAAKARAALMRDLARAALPR